MDRRDFIRNAVGTVGAVLTGVHTDALPAFDQAAAPVFAGMPIEALPSAGSTSYADGTWSYRLYTGRDGMKLFGEAWCKEMRKHQEYQST